MNVNRSTVAAFAAAVAVAAAGWVILGSGQIEAQVLPGPTGTSGERVWPAFEGWGPLKDGTNTILIGYSNVNSEQELDIPIGPNNRIEPGGPDFGQPTHFFAGRHYGVFAIPVPRDFGTNRFTWTLTANGHTSEVQFWVNPPYWVDFFKHAASGNESPVARYTRDGKEMTGPPTMKFDQTYEVAANQPVKLTLYVSDQPPTYDPFEGLGGAAVANAGRGRGAADAGGGGGGRGRGNAPRPDVTVKWEKYRGTRTGWVSIDDDPIELFKKKDGEKVIDEHEVMEATTQAWFDTPGEYWLLGTINDQSGNGGGGDQCCWTSTHVRVNVK